MDNKFPKPIVPASVNDSAPVLNVPKNRQKSPTETAFELPETYDKIRNENRTKAQLNKPYKQAYINPATIKKVERLRLRKELLDAYGEHSAINDPNQPYKLISEEEKKKSRWKEKLWDIGSKADVFAFDHAAPIHHLCIAFASAFIPFFLLTITWDLMAALVFEIPHLSSINSPTFILVINFVSIPLSMYGYMIEYLVHEHSRMSIIALICVFIHPILFLIRAYMEYIFDGFRNEEKHYYESAGTGELYEYPIGTFGPYIKS